MRSLRDTTSREVGRPRTARSAAVVHAGVLHAEDLGLLVGGEPGGDDLAEEDGVPAPVEGVADLAVDPGHGLVKDGGAAGTVVVRDLVERLGLEVDVDR